MAAAMSALFRCSVLAVGCLLAAGGVAAGSREDDGDDDHRPVEARVGADHYAAGGRVRIDAPVAGDAIAAGGSVDQGADVAGDAVLAGGTVEVRGRVGDDLYAAGGTVRVDGAVAESARVVGGTVTVGRQARFGGGGAVAGGQVRFDGAAARVLYLAGGNVRFDGEAAGDVIVAGREVEIGPQARIAGTLTVRSASAPRVADGARIDGGMRHERVEVPQPPAGTVKVVGGTLFAAWVVGLLLLGVLLIAVLPGFVRRTGEALRQRPLASAGLGFALLVGVPVGAVLLMVTVIGIPVGLLALAAYFPLLLLGYLAAVVAAGDAALARVRPGASGLRARAVAFGIALVVFALAARIPWIGPWIGLGLLLLGLGALTLSLARTRAGAPVAG